MIPAEQAADPVAPGTTIGHVHLRVADLERAIGFYSGMLGFDVTQRYGDQAAFLCADGRVATHDYLETYDRPLSLQPGASGAENWNPFTPGDL